MTTARTTRAAWYEKNGEARDVMVLGDLPLQAPSAGEVCVHLLTSGVNPSDVKSRRARPLTDPWVVPHSDGAGIIEAARPIDWLWLQCGGRHSPNFPPLVVQFNWLEVFLGL